MRKDRRDGTEEGEERGRGMDGRGEERKGRQEGEGEGKGISSQRSFLKVGAYEGAI